jgi:hypothetical protein
MTTKDILVSNPDNKNEWLIKTIEVKEPLNRITAQQSRLFGSIEGLSDAELHALLVRNAVKRYEESWREVEELFQTSQNSDEMNLDELFAPEDLK